MIKRLAKTTLGKLGYEIHKSSLNGVAGFDPSYLVRICQPKTVIDVGVGYGTYPLYQAFPQAKFVLVEPLREYDVAIGEIAGKYDCDILYKAVSNAPGTREMIVDTMEPERSSFADRTPLTTSGNRLEKRLIEVTTLDTIFADAQGWKKPILLKLDTEGHELEALQGSKSLLRETDTVIAEVSIAKRFEQGYEFEDLILFMKEHGFYLSTFLGITQASGELRPRFADIVFQHRPQPDPATPG